MFIIQWEEDKAVETVLYLAARLKPEHRTPAGIGAALYHADKLHLKLGYRTICRDAYAAGPDGIYPVNTRRLMGTGRPAAFRNEDGRIITERAPDVMELSRTDEECLDAAAMWSNGIADDELVVSARDATWEIVTYHGSLLNDPERPHLPVSFLGVVLTLPDEDAVRVIRNLYINGMAMELHRIPPGSV
jgi:hypothetical protein